MFLMIYIQPTKSKEQTPTWEADSH